MILNCLTGKPLPVYGEGKNVRDWLYVEDHAKALWILLKNGRKGETYNIGGNEEWRNIHLIHVIIQELALLAEKDAEIYKNLITYVKDRAGHDYRYAIDSSKIQQALGWIPDHTFQEGFKKAIAWYMNSFMLSKK